MFRIDRRFVKLSGTRVQKRDTTDGSEVGAEEEVPDAATSVETRAETSVDDIINDYLSTAEQEVQTKEREILDAARKKAEQLMDDAIAEAEMILDNAKIEAQEQRMRGREEGHAEGAEEGRRSFDEQLAEKIREDDERLKIVLDEIHKERERIQLEAEEDIANLSLEIVRKIINPAEEELGNVFISLIKNALRQVPTDGKIIIRVGPEEYERFFSSGAATIELDSGVTVSADVLRDISLEEGDCIIDTEDITINAGLESQLKYVKLAFERANQYEPET